MTPIASVLRAVCATKPLHTAEVVAALHAFAATQVDPNQ